MNFLWASWAVSALLSSSLAVADSGITQRAGSREKHVGGNDTDFHKGHFTKVPQDEKTCQTYKEKQWAGTVDVSDDKRLFYWFFDSRDDPDNDPIIIWLNGGPGASSLNGIFGEMGPCFIPPNSTKSAPNKHSWNNRASLLSIDQPAGVGFSQIRPGAPFVGKEIDAAADLQTFFRLFFEKVFPEKAHLPIYFAGESYGGHYVPVTMKYILDSREANSSDAFWGNITSMIFVNPYIHILQFGYGIYEIMCTHWSGKGPRWNQTVCEQVAESTPEPELLNLKCDYTYDGQACEEVFNADLFSLDLINTDADNGIRDPHNIDLPCYDSPYCDRPTQGNLTAYLNQPSVLKALGIPTDIEWEIANGGPSNAFRETLDYYKPTTRQISTVLDAHRTYAHRKGKPPITALLMNGNLDTTCGTPSQEWVFGNEVRWSGAAPYRANKWQPWETLHLGTGSGRWKQSKGEQFVFLAVDGAGHMVPLDQPAVADEVVKRWVHGKLLH